MQTITSETSDTLHTAPCSDRIRSGLLSSGSTFRIRVKTPFNFIYYHSIMLRGQCLPIPYLFSENDWKCVVRLDSGNLIPTLVSSMENSTFLSVRCFYDVNTAEEVELKEILSGIFCANLDLQEFYGKASNDVSLGKTINNLNGLKPTLSFDPFASLIKAVMRQLISAQAARCLISLLVRRLGTKVTIQGQDFYGFPSPDRLANATKKELLECKVGYKWQLIKEISGAVVSKSLDIDKMKKMKDQEVIDLLTETKGVGYWTSRIFLYDGLGRINSYPTHDISLKKAVSMLYYNGENITWDEVDSFFSNYREFVGIASYYLFGALWLRKLEA